MDEEAKELLKQILAEMKKLNKSVVEQESYIKKTNTLNQAKMQEAISNIMATMPPAMRSAVDKAVKPTKEGV